MGRATPDFHPGRTDRSEALGIVGRGRDRFGEIASDLSLGDVESGDKLNIPDMVASEIEMHDSGDGMVAGRGTVEFDALDERRSAVADPN